MTWIAAWCTIRKKVVNKHNTLPNETIMSNINKLTDKAMGLNLGARTNLDTTLNLDKWTNIDIISEAAFIEIARLNNHDTFAALHITNPGFEYLWFTGER